MKSLVAAVFVLSYERAFRSDRYLGRAAHKLALELIARVNPALSEELHHHDGLMPLTVSDLFQSDTHHHWLRLTALREDVAAVLQKLVEADARHIRVDGWQVEQAVMSQHDWCGSAAPADLIDEHWQAERSLTLKFETATSFKSVGLYRPVPEPALVFKSLYERWQRLIGVALPFAPQPAALEAFARDLLSIEDYALEFVAVPMKQGVIPAFRGRVKYHIERQNGALAKRDPDVYPRLLAQHAEYASLLHLLAHFGFYAGVGIKTAQGMGMMRPR